jgi:hypothetical protein
MFVTTFCCYDNGQLFERTTSHKQHACKLRFNEGVSYTAILGTMSFVDYHVVTIAAIWVGRIAVRLDLRNTWAAEARRMSIELEAISWKQAYLYFVPYATSRACANIRKDRNGTLDRP